MKKWILAALLPFLPIAATPPTVEQATIIGAATIIMGGGAITKVAKPEGKKQQKAKPQPKK